MLRSLSRRSRSIRVPLQNGPINLQRVAVTRHSRPVFTRLLTTLILSYCLVGVASYALPQTRDGRNAAAAQVENVTQQKVWPQNTGNLKHPTKDGTTRPQPSQAIQEDLQASGTFHLMLPVWIRKRDPAPLVVDAARLKVYQELQADKNKIDQVKEQVTKVVQQQMHTRKYAQLLKTIGRYKQASTSLDILPNANPSPVYEVPCVFFKPDTITYGWRTLPNATGEKVDRMFHPVLFAQAFYQGLRIFAIASYEITKARVLDQLDNLKTSDRTSPNQGGRPSSSSGLHKKDLSRDQEVQRRLGINALTEQGKEKWLPFLRGEYGKHVSRQDFRDVVKSMTYQGAIETGCVTFQTRWVSRMSEVHQRVRNPNAVFVVGQVAFIGERGTLHFDIDAFYSMETNTVIATVIRRTYIIPRVQFWKGMSQLSPLPQAKLNKTTNQDALKEKPTASGANANESSNEQEHDKKGD